MGSGADLRDGELVALLRLGLLPGVGDRRVGRLVEVFGSARRALRASARAFSAVAGEEAAKARALGEGRAIAERALERARARGVRVLPWNAPDYPPTLHHLHDPPPVLFVQGRLDLLDGPTVAVVGSRRATASGRRSAEVIGRCLAEAGIAVASGLAMGIDAAAHRGALHASGNAVGVLGSGVDVPYPRANRDLFRALERDHVLVSEFLPGTSAAPHHFPKRNRILAALSSAVIVVEAARRSGALITVDHALDLGREVLAVPGPVDRVTSAGTNALIRDGATIVCDPWGVVECLPASMIPRGGRDDAGATGREPARGLPEEAVRVLDVLDEGDRTAEELARKLGMGVGRVFSILSELEVQGWAELLPGARYARVGRDPRTAGTCGNPSHT